MERVKYRVFQKIIFIFFKLSFSTEGTRSLGNPDLAERFVRSACDAPIYIGFFGAVLVSLFEKSENLAAQIAALGQCLLPHLASHASKTSPSIYRIIPGQKYLLFLKIIHSFFNYVLFTEGGHSSGWKAWGLESSQSPPIYKVFEVPIWRYRMKFF